MSADWLSGIDPRQPVLIAGPTASGKSALALDIAARRGGVIVNADALQVFSNWRILTARPSAAETARTPHLLYGHVPGTRTYSVGHWLRDVAPHLNGQQRPIIVGGTGLYFTALTEGLAEVPQTPPEVRARADARLAAEGRGGLLAELDAKTAAKIDRNNPVRVQRAWEVLQSTGRGLADWQDETPAPLLPPDRVTRLLLEADREWLGARIEARFDRMVLDGALAEAEANRADWDPKRPSSKAIGAPELIAYLNGEMPLEAAIEAGKIATRQYAKRQRTWFRSKMRDWTTLHLP